VRNLVNVAILSFDVLRVTGAGVAGEKDKCFVAVSTTCAR
jgi:hypothetical protein